MPEHLYVTITESLRVQLKQAVERLLERAAREDGPLHGFEEVRQIVEALPLTSAEFAVAVNRLVNAERYLCSGERGAASYELRLLLRGLDK